LGVRRGGLERGVDALLLVSSMRQDWLAKLAEAHEPDQTTHLEWLSVTPVTRRARALEEPRRSGDDVHLHGAIVSADNDPAGRLVEAQVHPLAADP